MKPTILSSLKSWGLFNVESPSIYVSFLSCRFHIFQFPNKWMHLKLTEQLCESLHLLISLPVSSWMSNWKILNWAWQCMPIIWDMETEESEVPGPLELHSKFRNSQNYTRPCFKQARKQTQEQIKKPQNKKILYACIYVCMYVCIVCILPRY